MLWITTTPGWALQSNGSMFCMIGGADNLPSKMERTKSLPSIDAITSGGVTPYLVSADARSSMTFFLAASDYGHHTKQYIVPPAILGRFSSGPQREASFARHSGMRRRRKLASDRAPRRFLASVFKRLRLLGSRAACSRASDRRTA